MAEKLCDVKGTGGGKQYFETLQSLPVNSTYKIAMGFKPKAFSCGYLYNSNFTCFIHYDASIYTDKALVMVNFGGGITTIWTDIGTQAGTYVTSIDNDGATIVTGGTGASANFCCTAVG